jgi:hypothetical protein
MRTTLDGRLAGWWRLGPAAGPLPADTRLDALDPEEPLLFHFVENQVRMVDLEVWAGATPTRLRAPLGTAVPVQSLVDALAVLLDLPAGDWVLVSDGAVLEANAILEDRPSGGLVLRRA